MAEIPDAMITGALPQMLHATVAGGVSFTTALGPFAP